MSRFKVFVYGTLKRNEPNHNWLSDTNNGNSKYLGEGTTLQKYPLIIGTRYNVPFLLDKAGVGNNVIGEIYDIDEKMLSNLDILEDCPNFYERSVIPIKMNTVELDCWTYFIKRFKDELLLKEMLVSYSNKGSHNLPYAERYLRDPSYDFRSEILPEF
ncbi:putative gamma-glutamylcyclotransferase CG2811 isoform X2 [Halyomorpha halys]|uniref:putative gamma-glutamylcyclotransferase CG2811 isoform X2 n=1 Tax=Halyomorpha halys TaxID=286706 RepID=UPI0006D523AD|nr:putative gamma-glutamylcyclotransferase CG2811 isoform X2 [Halyomorpha halys]